MINETMQLLRGFYYEVIGNGFFHVLWALSVLYLLLSMKHRDWMKKIGWPILILFIIIANPLTGYLILWCTGTEGYSRTAWCLLMEGVIALAVVDLILRVRGKVTKVLVAVICTALILVSGHMIFTPDLYYPTNTYKLMGESIEIAQYLETEHPDSLVYVESTLGTELRQYDAHIEMVAGRYEAFTIDSYLESPDWKILIEEYMQAIPDMDVVVIQSHEDWRQKMDQLGWSVEHTIGAFDIYVLRQD